MFIVPTSDNNQFNMIITFGLKWKSKLQINQCEIPL
jgi:hypothetical protein